MKQPFKVIQAVFTWGNRPFDFGDFGEGWFLGRACRRHDVTPRKSIVFHLQHIKAEPVA